MRKSTIQVRVETDALDAWRRALGAQIDDRAAANSALRVAADIQRREKEAMAYGMERLLDWVARGLADPQALADGDVEITVADVERRGVELRVRIGQNRFVLGSNPTYPALAAKVAEEVAADS